MIPVRHARYDRGNSLVGKWESARPKRDPARLGSLNDPFDAVARISEGRTPLSTDVRLWAAISIALGVVILLAGIAQLTDATLRPFERGGTAIMIGEGAALAGFALMILVMRRRFEDLSRSNEARETSGSDSYRSRPYTTLFLVSFVALFVEVMLIRYCSSQIRIFAYYKNVPLVGCFLGLGLGCCLGNGRSRHALLFTFWLLPLTVFLAAGSIVVDRALGVLAAAGSSEHILGDVGSPLTSTTVRILTQLIMSVFCVAILVAITSLFTFLGRLLGEAFESVPRLPGYTVNIVGSLAGILGFVLLSYAQTPPWVWFLVGLIPLAWWFRTAKRLVVVGLLIAANTLAVMPSIGDTVWSSYQKLVGHVIPAGYVIPPGEERVSPGKEAYLVRISDVFYQVAIDLRPEAFGPGAVNPFPHYDEVYRRLGRRPERVLIVGAGTGNDVAAALRAGASHVDAVDIDPAIVAMGRRHHPERPYDDPRVQIIINDARDAFRRLQPQSYDVVVFGLLDSHTQLASSSVRLDNYVFTLESLQEARGLVRPGGHIIITAAAFRDWFRDRFTAMLEATCDGPVEMFQFGKRPFYTYIGQVHREAETAPHTRSAAAGAGVLPTDDWPFLYLPEKSVPRAYVIMVITLAVASVIVVKVGGLDLGRFSRYHAHMFFLGAAFLLMEVSAVNRLALLFGTTWLVSAVTIAIVLVLIVFANLTVLAVRVPYPMAYGALIVSLAVSYWLQPSVVLGRGTCAALVYGLLVLSPIYFAGLVFARSFSVATLAGPAIGANIMGSVLGGWVEYSTMAVGIRALVLLAGVFYVFSLCLLLVRRKDERVPALRAVP